ncbi:LPS export ABC transporter periplasmic protein LptC [Legionella lytica]|uniref:LPS export ABC transporter periplasmic protein LptC n=1 Tax=Legionella lytica TaxID=96232 RepID=A0ABY4Y6F6_9GAMM|nr:LPS export ABC transporter periplasmic protein LptC [Legionella lytica]USQ13211.1 LPS export ABC transporter periplasmic protein LptC [Legionella lytica]
MNAAKQGIWFFLVLIALAGSGWYYSHSSRLLRLDSETLANSVDTTISRVKVRQFDDKGSLTTLLATPKMRHVQKGDMYFFKKPHILVSQDKQPPWDIRSNHAKSFDGGQRIVFIGDVIVHQTQGDNVQGSTLKTEEVTYYPNEKKASTDLLVTYEQPGNIIQSKGMNAYLDEKRVELLHQARGSYVPANG